MTLIWATRGRTWGFRFLRDGGLDDPLPAFEAAFADLETGPSGFRRSGDTVAVRISDPVGRKDAAGRLIPHEFVLLPPLSEQIDSVEDCLELVWPRFANEYASIWDSDSKRDPSADGP